MDKATVKRINVESKVWFLDMFTQASFLNTDMYQEVLDIQTLLFSVPSVLVYCSLTKCTSAVTNQFLVNSMYPWSEIKR